MPTFVITGGTGCCPYDDLRCSQFRRVSYIVAAAVSRISWKLILYVPSHMTNYHECLMQKTCIHVCLLCVICMFYCIYILHSYSKLESSHLINYPFIMTQVVWALKSMMFFGQWLVAHAAPSHCVKPGLIYHQYLNLSFHKQGSWLRKSGGTELIMYVCWTLYRCLGGELWYLQHNCVGDDIVCH